MGKLTKEDEFESLVRPIIKYINDNYNPHTIIIVSATEAQIFKGYESTGEVLNDVKD